MIKFFKIIVVLFVLLVLFIFGLGYFIFPDMCGNEVIETVTSPNKKWKLVLFTRDCGATTGYTSQISLLLSDKDLPDELGNIYRAKGYPNNYILKWETDTSVTVIIQNFKVFKKIKKYENIEFKYE